MLEQKLPEHIIYEFKTPSGLEPVRLDKYLHLVIEGITRNRVQNAILEGKVTVNNQLVKANYKLKPNEHIVVKDYEAPRKIEVIPQEIPLEFIYEDEYIAVVNKPAGMVVHPGVGNFEGTMVNALAHHFGKEVEEGNIRPWLVHRIDKDTSGILVVAKTVEASEKLAKQFKQHSIQRKYRALVWGVPENNQGTIKSYIKRSHKDRKKFIASDENDGKWAVTHYKVLESFQYVSFLECQLETGRTHQIRVHMKSIGHTLFNDSFYDGNKILKGVKFKKYKQFVSNCFDILPTQALHAFSLGFIHPITEKKLYFEQALPPNFEQVLNKWRMVESTAQFS